MYLNVVTNDSKCVATGAQFVPLEKNEQLPDWYGSLEDGTSALSIEVLAIIVGDYNI